MSLFSKSISSSPVVKRNISITDFDKDRSAAARAMHTGFFSETKFAETADDDLERWDPTLAGHRERRRQREEKASADASAAAERTAADKRTAARRRELLGRRGFASTILTGPAAMLGGPSLLG